jgi:hypothetical protein
MVQLVNEKIATHEDREFLGFNLIYHSAALAQSITKTLTNEESLSLSEEFKTLSAETMEKRISLIKNLCSAQDNKSEKDFLWNEFLAMDLVTNMTDHFRSTEKIKVYRKLVQNLKEKLMNFESAEAVRQGIDDCKDYIEKEAPGAFYTLTMLEDSEDSCEAGYHESARLGILN